MADKQALRDFQARLAERLQSARAGGTTASWLAVRAGARPLLIPLSHAAEIFPWSAVQPVPFVRRWFLGVSNLRGTLNGVVDLAAFLDHAADVAPRTSVALAQCRLVGFNDLLGVNCALLVDELLGMRTADAFVRSTPADASAPPYFGSTYVSVEGESWREINLQALAQHEPFIDVAA